ncbi:MAG: hypothetical protein JSY10_20650 [Paenibacillus sp.]|nr:hypothetical protein [Paenibacillus sp.]
MLHDLYYQILPSQQLKVKIIIIIIIIIDINGFLLKVEMQQEIQKLVSENELYESRPEDEPFEDSIKWLIDLDRKDQYSKDKEIEKIHLDYTGFLNK